MNYIFDSIHYSINFYGFVQNRCHDAVQHMKAKAFEHKLIYYATYDLNTQRYLVTQNYDSFWYILYFYITNYLLKLNYEGLSYTDLELLVKVQNMIIITSYILAGQEYTVVYDENKKFDKNIRYKIVYAVTDRNDDLTHELNMFKKSSALLTLKPQHIYNIATHYGKKYEKKEIQTIKYMRDDNFEETVLST